MRKVYSNMELMRDSTFRDGCMEQYDLLDSMAWDTVIIDCKMKRSQIETAKSNMITRIDELTKERDELDIKDKYRKRKIFKLNRKIDKLTSTLKDDSDIVFGSKSILREVTYNKNMFRKTNDIQYLHQYNKKKEEFRQRRILPYRSIGKSENNGNRKFKFDFEHNKITFKPSLHDHFEINIHPSNKQKAILLKIQEMTDKNQMPIT